MADIETSVARSADDTADEAPPLESGDRLDRAEFERRYAAMRGDVKAELIGGIVYVASPTKRRHARPHGHVVTWLGNYVAATPGTEMLDDASDILGEEDEPQPDALLRLLPEAGGATRIDDDDYVCGGPELVVEVASSSASYDLHQKLDTYRRAGVREYVVVIVRSREVRWHRLAGDGGRYEVVPPGPDGIHRAAVFPGLWLDGSALLDGRLADVLATLARGMASAEHAAFVRALAERMGAR